MSHQESTRSKSLLSEAINAEYVFISVMGPHANESEEEIFARKTDDIKKAGESFWVSKINKEFVDECRSKLHDKTGYLILVKSSGKGKAADNTKTEEEAKQYSEEKTNWKDIDHRISPVTGKLGKGATAYYFDGIEMCNDERDLDLNFYGEGNDYLKAIKFRQGHSNVFAKKSEIKMPEGMKSHERSIVAVLRLKYPYVVWVR